MKSKIVNESINKPDLKPYIDPPKCIPFFLRPFIWLSEKINHKVMLPARLLAWRPMAGIASGLLETSAEAGGKKLGKRITALLRLRISFMISSPFLIDINAYQREKYNITTDEMAVLRGEREPEAVESLAEHERAALRYAVMLSKTPVKVDENVITDVKRFFSQEEMVIVAVLVGKVHYWGRFAEGLGVPPAGYHVPNDPELRCIDSKSGK
ncbi:MAG: hypothetical protein JXJ04_21240 [Spirochaetales bacterium]|nr:hypothetical protein [Spirochaetales bacterium]